VTEETKKERVDRELIELLNELRVALPGVQVLFAFLLTVPFSQRFSQITGVQKDVYFATFVSAALATIFLIAPSANHRVQFRQDDKEALLLRANWLAIVGTVFLACAVMGTTFLITDLLFGGVAPGVATAILAGLLIWFWYGVPIFRRLTGPGQRKTS
jgi:predicted neutral ceramidase superfamily lipid hydrolase